MAQWNANGQELPQEIEDTLTLETCTQFFDTLADWNSYLEQHVPYFSDQEDADAPQP